MSHIMPKAVALALACALTLPGRLRRGQNQPAVPGHYPCSRGHTGAHPTPAADPYDAVRTYWSEDQLTQAWGPDQAVEHLFFHPVIAYPEYAFSDAVPYDRQVGLDEWMVTADEYKRSFRASTTRATFWSTWGTCGVKSPARTASPAWSGTPSCSPRKKAPHYLL